MLQVDVPWNLPHEGHWWQPQHSSWAWHSDRTRQAGSVECRTVFVWAAESLASLCWKTLLLTAASFVNLADFIFVAQELCNGYVGTIPKVWAELMLCCLLCSWDWNPWATGVCKGYWWWCCIKHSRNKHLPSCSSFGQYALRKIRKSLRLMSVRVGLDLVSIDGMRAAEKKEDNWTHQDKGNTPDEDFGLAARWFQLESQ